MKKQFLNLGKALNKAEQRSINGGVMAYGDCVIWCGSGIPIYNVPNCSVDISATCRNQSGSYFEYCTC